MRSLHPLHLLARWALLCLLLAGCSPAPAAAPTEITAPPPTVTVQPSATASAVPPPTATRLPTQAPTLSPTPIPSPTVTPLPQPINAGTIDRLTVSESFTLQTRGSVRSLLWSPDGAWILAQTDDRLDVIDPDVLQITASYAGFVPRHFIQDGRLFGVQDRLPVLLDLVAGKIEPVRVTIPAEQTGLTGFDLSQDGQYFALPVDRLGFDVITLATGEARRYDFQMNNLDWFAVSKVSFSYDGTLVVVNAFRKAKIQTIVGVELKWGAKLYEFVAYGDPTFSTDGQRMTFETVNNRAITYITANGELWSDLSGRYNNQTPDGGYVSFSRHTAQFWNSGEPQGYKIGILYQGTYSNRTTDRIHWSNSQLLIYDLRNDDLLHSLLDLPPLIQAFTFSPDGTSFLLATQDGDLSRWDTTSGIRQRSATVYDVNTDPQISPDGQRIAYSYHTSARLFSLDGTLQQVITPTLDTLDLAVRFIDAERLALFYNNTSGQYVEFWDLAAAENTYIAPYIAAPCDFTPNGHTMVCYEKTTRFLDTRTGAWLMDVVNASFFAVSPDDQTIAHCKVGSPSIFLARRQGGDYLGMLTANGPAVCGSLSFSPDSARLASGAGFVWDVPTRTLAFNFQAADPHAQLVYGPQGDIFFVGGEIFDAATGSRLGEIPLQAQALYFSPDGTRLVAINPLDFTIWTTH